MMTLNEQAYEHLKKMITEDQLSYQEIYSETKLAKELGISRTPFRDAIHRLVQEGYIDIIPSKGFRLHQLTQQDVTETFQVRSGDLLHHGDHPHPHLQESKAAVQ